MVLDAGIKKLHVAGNVHDATVLIAVDIDRESKLRVLGVTVELKDAELHWREYLVGLVHRGKSSVGYIVTDDHLWFKAAR